MSILSENSKKMLVESMRSYVNEVLKESTSLTSKQATEKAKFVNENATYEQLLNITMNPLRESKYLPAYVLEGAVAVLHSACMTGRKNIGPNAITEGALKLQKKTGAVITESMMEAALTAVNEGCGLKIVGKILSEASLDPNMINAINLLTNHKANLNKSGVATDIVSIQNALKSAGINNTLEVIQNVENGASPLKAVAAARTQANVDKFEKIIKSGKDAGKNLSRDQLDMYRGRLARAKKMADLHNGNSGIGNSIQKAANASKGKTPWGKIALGVGAAGVGAAGLYKYWRNKKDMEQDRINGTTTF